jgi:5,6,7,8-tetrahydromethanopterin hydro-lyase
MIIGESFVGTGANAAHVNTVLGRRDGAVGAAWITALATPRAGFAPFVAIAQPGVAVVPPTLFVNKAAVEGELHGRLTWGAAQAGVAQGAGLAVGEGTVDGSQAGELVLIAAVWVNPAADDEKAVYENNMTATLEALRSGKAGGPGVEEFLAAARAPFNAFFERSVPPTPPPRPI